MGKMSKKFLLMVILGLLCFSTITSVFGANGLNFLDVAEDAWYVDAVSEIAKRGVMVGNGVDRFYPDKEVSKAEIFQTLYNLDGKPEIVTMTIKDKWYANAVSWAIEKGLIENGIEGFDDTATLTRVELTDILLKYDLNIVVTNVDEEGKLDPSGKVTRAELASILNISPEFEVSGKVIEIEKYGHAVLDITIENFMEMGYELGDTVNVSFDNGYVFENIPFFNGYYVDKGEPMLRAYPGHTNIAVCINYEKLNEVADVKIDNIATISLVEKGAQKDKQDLNSLVYTNVRDDYASDEIFANFRAINSGKIAKGVLYRSASPVHNTNGRASYSDKFVADAKIVTILNQADTDEDIKGFIEAEDFNSPYYKEMYDKGNVIPLGMSIDYSSTKFAETLVGGLAKLSEMDGPYLIHCTEGKDRAGFASALLESLMGATLDEVIEDYMISFENYYGITKENDPEKYNLIVKNNINDMVRVIAGVEKDTDLTEVDIQKGAEEFLLKYGMTAERITALKEKLSTEIK